MLKAKTSARAFRVRGDDFGDARAYVETLLAGRGVNGETSKDTLLVFDALTRELARWGLDENTELEIEAVEKLGNFQIRVGFEGEMFALEAGSADSAEAQILGAYGDKLAYSYRAGYNAIGIWVSRGHRTSMLACAVASLCAVVVYIPISFLLDAGGQRGLFVNFVSPLETLYANAMLMVGAPMTFFSLLKNLTDTHVVAQRNSGVRMLQVRTIATSALAILLAFVAFFAESIALSGLAGLSSAFGGSADRTFADVVTSFIPPSIFEPFAAVSPIPLMALALLCTYALCSAGKYFSTLRHAMMACYTLFSRMLYVVIAALPAFCFLAIMDVLLESGLENLLEIVAYFVACGLGTLLLFASYAVRLRVRGVRVVPFARKLVPLVRQNIRIGSAIDAAPYNIRYCSKAFNMDRGVLNRSLPVLAEINLDGNCFLLVFFSLAFVYATGTELSWLSFIGLAVLVLLLSLGAPNQPGSILIGMLIITMYLNAPEVVCVAIYLEAFFGIVQTAINVIGDIVMVAIDAGSKTGEGAGTVQK